MPTGRLAVISAMVRSMFLPSQNVAAVPHGDGEPDGRLPVHAEEGLRRVGNRA